MNSKMTQRVSRASLDDDFRCRRAFPLERLNTGSAVCTSYNSNRNQCRTEQLCCAVKNSTTLRCACAGMRTYILPISLILSFVVATNTVSATVEAGAAAEDSGESCATLGFPSVSCPTCETIKDIVADQDLTAECLKCCHEAKRASKKYASARLVYDPRLLGMDAELRGFIEERAAHHPALILQPRRYSRAALLMSEEGASPSEVDTVSIGRWKIDSISDYLHEHL